MRIIKLLKSDELLALLSLLLNFPILVHFGNILFSIDFELHQAFHVLFFNFFLFSSWLCFFLEVLLVLSVDFNAQNISGLWSSKHVSLLCSRVRICNGPKVDIFGDFKLGKFRVFLPRKKEGIFGLLQLLAEALGR